MDKRTQGVIFAAVMVIVIVTMDVLFFKHHTLQRLVANVGVAMVFVAFYWTCKNET